MAIDVRIKDSKGTGTGAGVESNGAVLTTSTGVPPKQDSAFLKPFASYLRNSAGSEDMQVVGSAASPQEFYIQAGAEGDRYLNTLVFVIADAGAAVNEFGALSALTNGCQLIIEDSEFGDVVIADSLQSNFDFLQLCNFEPAFGTGTSSMRLNNVVGPSEAFVMVLDLEDVFGLPYGLKLEKNSKNKVKIVVRDDTTGVDKFDVKAYGFDLLERKK
jgi:hypothetical protein